MPITSRGPDTAARLALPAANDHAPAAATVGPTGAIMRAAVDALAGARRLGAGRSVGVEAEADEVADAEHEGDDEHVPQGVGEDPAGEHRGAGHDQRLEPFDEPAVEIFGHADGGVLGAEQDGSHEDPAMR